MGAYLSEPGLLPSQRLTALIGTIKLDIQF